MNISEEDDEKARKDNQKGVCMGVLCGLISGIGFLFLTYGEKFFEHYVFVGLSCLFLGMVCMVFAESSATNRDIDRDLYRDEMDFGPIVALYTYVFFGIMGVVCLSLLW